jgi:hypothetical protein
MWIALLTHSLTSDVKPAQSIGHLICDIINQYLAEGKFKIKGIRKITITLTYEDGVNYIGRPIKGVSPVLNIRKSFDFNGFNLMPQATQNETMLSLIEDLLMNALKGVDVDQEIFKAAITEVRNRDFRQKTLLWKPKASKDKKFKASIEYELLPGEAIVLAVVFFDSSDSMICKAELIRTRPDFMFIAPYLGGAKWISKNEFELVDKSGELRFKVCVDDCRSEMNITPQKRTSDEIIDSILISSASTPDDQAVSLLKQKIKEAGGTSNESN